MTYSDKTHIFIVIQGRVQGVHFRGAAKAQADKLNITGFAENNPDGSVTIQAEGNREVLEEFLQWCFHGSVLAHVEGLQYQWGAYSGGYSKFIVKRHSNDIVKDQMYAFKNLGKRLIELPSDTIKPVHVAIIPDGNRRWAKERNLPTLEGHRRGLNNFFALADDAKHLGIKYITFWGFSTENWNRSDKEVEYLLDIFRGTVKKFRKKFQKDKVHFTHFGRKDRLPSDIVQQIEQLEAETKDFDQYYVNLALDYGGQDEIIRAINRAVENGANPGTITEDTFTELLDTKGMPNPDLIIRTSGEKRLSGLLPWQAVYAELYFTNVKFPDFDSNELKTAVLDFSNRQRRFGA